MAILNHQAKPSKATWIVWTVVDSLNLASMWAHGNFSLQVAAAVTGNALIVVLALRFGEPSWSRTNQICLTIAGLGMAGWLISGNPLIGMFLSLGATLIGGLPTVLSAWREPANESRLAWSLFCGSCILTVLILPRWTLTDAAQPLVYLFINAAMAGIVWLRPWRIGKKAAACN